jgi:GT2 family glycosyltransferase
MKISVVIPTCNRPTDLALCLECLDSGRQGLAADSFEIIVTDDGDAIQAKEALGDRYPWVRFVTGPRKGPAANRNHGAAQATGDWLVFTDDDCLPEVGWLRAYADAIQTNSSEYVFEGRTSATGLRTRMDEEAPNNDQGGNLWSCNFCILRSVFMELGQFDEAFPSPAMEDVEFRVRARKAGYALFFVPMALVLHPWRLRKGRRFTRGYAASVKYFLTKHPELIEGFSARKLLWNFMRELLKNRFRDSVQYHARGFIREIGLDFYTLYSLIIAVQKF